MNRQISQLVFVGLFSLSATVAHADWAETKARALAYHDQFERTDLSFSGTFEGRDEKPGTTRQCSFAFDYEGHGKEPVISGMSMAPASPASLSFCNEATQTVKNVARTGAGFSAAYMRNVMASFEKPGIAPELVASDDTSETYQVTTTAEALDLPTEGLTQNSVTIRLVFSKAEGRLMSYIFEGTQTQAATEAKPETKVEFISKNPFGVLESGQPYAAGGDQKSTSVWIVDGQTQTSETTQLFTVTTAAEPILFVSTPPAEIPSPFGPFGPQSFPMIDPDDTAEQD